MRGTLPKCIVSLVPPRPRDAAPGIHHVWVNATGNWAYFVDGVDRMAWLRLLVRVTQAFDWRCAAFCQMTTHVHAILEVPDGSLPEGMRYLNREYSKNFNARHERVGQFVRRRYGSRRVGDARDLLGVYAYVVLNPVRQRLCPRAEDWRWSSYASTLGESRDFAFVEASTVLAEVNGSVDALRRFVSSEAERHR